jgi:3,4-dihydroxy 2-butanone 4-phosphate synthase / GTP cyclohydrolase II
MMVLSTVEDGIEEIRQGRMIIVVDDEDRENEGDLVMAADKATPEAINFMAKYGRGLICVPMTGERLDELQIPMMVPNNTAPLGTAFTQTVDARHGVTTGISAYDRAVTTRALVAPGTKPTDLTRCGRSRAGCCAGPATPRRRSIWPAWPAAIRRASSAKSSTTTAGWRGCPS